MKKKSTMIKTMCLAASFAFMANMSKAATITATVSGNWSSASTWSGGAAGATVSIDNIVIPAGITVTMDEDVTINGLLASVAVSGSLTSSSNMLIVTQGSLSGNGNMNLQYLEIGTLGSMGYSGSLTAHKFVNSSLSLTLGAQVMLMDTMHLKAGSITLGTGANLTMNTNSNIKVEDGSMTLGTGGVFTNTNPYNVIYVGSSKTTGMEMGGTSVDNVWVNLSGSNQNLTMGSGTLTVNGTMHHNMGTIKLNGSTMILKGDYMSSNGSMFSGSAASNLMIEYNSSLNSHITFDNTSSATSSLNNLGINIANGGIVGIESSMTINGNLMLTKGSLNAVSNATMTMGAGSTMIIDDGTMMTTAGGFNGTASYGVHYIGSSKMANIELSGSGLNDVMLDMTNASDSVSMAGNIVVNGTLNLHKGAMNLHGHKMEIKGGLTTTNNGMFQGDQNSDLFITTTGSLGDTIMFDSSRNRLNNFNINTGNGSNVMLNSSLMVENMTFTNGGLTIWDNDITINSTGTFTGYSPTKYIAIKGNGSLMMNINPSSPYVIYPVGTVTSYAPANIQRNSGSAGMVGVSTHNGIWMMGTYGSDNALTESVVNRTWDIHSSSSVNLNLQLEWSTAMEVNSFDRTHARISHYTNNAWDNMGTSTASVTGTGTYQLTRTNITSLSPFAVVDQAATVGIEELSNTMTASVYPVPVENKLTVTIPTNENFTVEVYDAVGNKVKSKAFTQDTSVHQLEMSDLNSGVYFVKISTDKSQAIKRIVKQ